MAQILQVTWQWTGFPGSTGYTNLYFGANTGSSQEALDASLKSHALFLGIGPALPSLVRTDLVTDVKLLNDADGQLITEFTVSGIGGVTGSGGTTGYSAPSGGCIDWLTGKVHGRHLMTGRTFVVPLAQGQYENNGSLTTTCVTTLATAAENMRTAAGPTFGVWGRPRPARTVGGVTRPALVGAWWPAISSRVPDKAVVLRSRRD